MRLKQCIFALVAMLLCAFSANAQVTTEEALEEALTAGGEVTLGADINVAAQIEIPAGKTVVLDLAGYDIIGGWNGSSTTNHIYVLSNRGTLTIKDSGTEGKIVSRGIYNYGTLTLESGIIDACDGNGGYAVNNESGSTFIMNGGVVSASYEDGDAPGDGNYDATALDVPADCTATLNGGKITSVTNYTYAISLAGKLIVPETSTVEVTGAHGAISMSAGSADIDGGTFICSGVQGQTDNVVYVTGGKMDISGGTFEHTGNLVNANSGAAVVMDGADGELTISGGEFTGLNGSVSGNANTTLTGGSYGSYLGYDSWDNIKQYVPEGKTVTIEGESYTNVAPAPAYVAKIGEQGYATFAEALTAASAMSGDVTIEVYDKVTLNTAFSGSYSSINFVGKDTDAEIYLDVQGYITATGKKVSFTDLKLSKSVGGHITNAGFMNVAFGIYDVTEVAYTNCVFANGAYASSGNVTFNGCTFYRSHDKYGLWAYGNVDATVEGCTFADYRGIKMYAEGAAKTVDLTVKSCDFSAVTDKPAIVLTYGESVVLEGNTYSSTGTFELDLDGAPNGTAVTSDVAPTCKNDNGACGVLVDGKIYTTVAQAAEVAAEGSNVTLLYSTTDAVEFAEGVNLTLANDVTADNVTVATSGVVVAKIGDVEYTSLQAALDAAAAGTGNVTVKILADVNLTGIDWNPVTVSGPGYPLVTVEGNDKTITGLNNMLFAGTWAGNSGLIIKNLTIANSAIVNDKDDAKGTVGVGAFIGYPQASATITLENCHLKESSVEGGHWTGGLIGMAGGYNGEDGPVFMNLTIKGCSVTSSTITGKGSVGGVIGHGSCSAWTNVVIEETTVEDNTITSTGSSTNKAGAVMGTIGAAGQPTTANGETKTGGASVSATVAGNNVTSNGTEITTIYGRQGTNTGMLYVAGGLYDNYPIEENVAYAAPVEGYEIVENADGTYGVELAPTDVKVATLAELQAALADNSNELPIIITETIVIPEGETVVLDLNGKTVTHQDEATKYAINNLGTLTIQDTKGNGSINARGIYNGYGNGGANVATAKITVLSGTINAKGTDGGAAIFNYGVADIQGGNFTSIGGYSLNNQSGASMTIAAGVTANNGIYANGATLVVNGGEINGNRSGCHVLYAWNSNVTIAGGTFHNNNSGNSTTMAGGTTKLTINGGTFSIANGKSTNGWTSCLIDATDGGKYEINGGEFKGHFRVQANCAMEINGGTFENTHGEAYVNGGTVAVKGGTFTDAAAQKFATDNLAAGYELDENGTVVQVNYVAKIGDVEYTSLQAAIEAVQEGETITLTSDVNVTTPAYGQNALNHARAVSFTLDLNGKELSADTGNSVFRFNIANSGATSDVTLTIKNGTIVSGSNTWCTVMAAGISTNVKAVMNLEDLTIVASKAGDLAVKAWDNATINAKNVTVNTTNGAGGFYAVGGEIVLDNCTVNQKGLHTAPYNSMAFAVSNNGKMTVNSGTYSAEPTAATEGNNQGTTHGSWVGGVMNSGGTLIINGGTFSNGNFGDDALATAARGLIFGDTNANIEIKGGTFNALKSIFDFQNNLGGTSPVFTIYGGTYSANPSVVTSYGSVTIADGYSVVENADGTFGVEKAAAYVAKIGEQGYETLAAALAEAQDGDVVTLVWAEGDAPIAMNGSVFGKNVTITGTATVDWSKGWFFVGRGGEGDATVTFDGANLTSASANENSGLGIHVSGREKGTDSKYNGTLVIKNSTIALDYLINRGAIELGEGAVLTVKNGFGIAGRPASETESGEAATATVTLNNGSKLVVNNHNGMGVGQAAKDPEGYGVMNVNAGATFETTQAFLVTSNGTMNVAAGAAVNVNGTLTVNGTLVSAGDIAATIAAGTGATIEISGGVYTQNVNEWCVENYAALPDLNGNYVVGVKPTATVNNLGMTTVAAGDYSIWNGSFDQNTEDDGDMPLSFVMQFLADQDAEDMATSPYADWYGDFVITFTGIEEGSFTADGCYLAGHYGSFGWVKVPVDGMTIEEGARYPVMLGVGLGQKYDYICSSVEDFKCALYLTPEILEANPNIQVKLELGVVDNSKGSDAAANALVNNENVYSVTEYTYDAEDFVVDPNYIAELTIDDANPVDYTSDLAGKKVGKLTYKRTFIAGIWNPMFVPFEVDIERLVNEFGLEVAYYNQMISDENENGGFDYKMEVKHLTSGVISHYPLFVKVATATEIEYVAEDVVLSSADEFVITTSSVTNTFKLYGTHQAKSVSDLNGKYAINASNGLWTPSSSGIKPHRLYFEIQENNNNPFASSPAKSIGIVVRGEDGTTGVEEITGENGEEMIFDLQGRRVLEPQKGGLYIVNGKKVIY